MQDYQKLTDQEIIDLLAEYTQRYTHQLSNVEFSPSHEADKQTIKALIEEIDRRKNERIKNTII